MSKWFFHGPLVATDIVIAPTQLSLSQYNHMNVKASQITGTQLFVQQFVQANSKGNIKAQHYWPFMMGIRQRATNVESVFMSSRHHVLWMNNVTAGSVDTTNVSNHHCAYSVCDWYSLDWAVNPFHRMLLYSFHQILEIPYHDTPCYNVCEVGLHLFISFERR